MGWGESDEKVASAPRAHRCERGGRSEEQLKRDRRRLAAASAAAASAAAASAAAASAAASTATASAETAAARAATKAAAPTAGRQISNVVLATACPATRSAACPAEAVTEAAAELDALCRSTGTIQRPRAAMRRRATGSGGRRRRGYGRRGLGRMRLHPRREVNVTACNAPYRYVLLRTVTCACIPDDR